VIGAGWNGGACVTDLGRISLMQEFIGLPILPRFPVIFDITRWTLRRHATRRRVGHFDRGLCEHATPNTFCCSRKIRASLRAAAKSFDLASACKTVIFVMEDLDIA